MNATTEIAASSPARQAFRILQFGFTVAPILAGLDKFLHLLVNWDQYVPGVVAGISPLPVHTLMFVVGVIEIMAASGGAFCRATFSFTLVAGCDGLHT